MTKAEREVQRYRDVLTEIVESIKQDTRKMVKHLDDHKSRTNLSPQAKEAALARIDPYLLAYQSVIASVIKAADSSHISQAEIGLTGLKPWDSDEFRKYFRS